MSIYMNTYMKKIVSVVVAFTIVSMVLVGCNTESNLYKEYKYTSQNEFDTLQFNQINTKLIPDDKATGKLVIADFGNSLKKEPANKMRIIKAIDIFEELYPNVEVEYALKELPDTWNTEVYDNMAEEFSTKIKTEFMAGKGSDIVFLKTSIDYMKMAKSEVFANMSEFFKNDEYFDDNEYNKQVLYGGQPYGKQYVIPLSYVVPTVVTTKSNLDRMKVNFSDCINHFEMINMHKTAMINLNINSTIDLYGMPNIPYNYTLQGFVTSEDIFGGKISIDNKDTEKFFNNNKEVFYDKFGVPQLLGDDYIAAVNYMINGMSYLSDTTSSCYADSIAEARLLNDNGQEAEIFSWKNKNGDLMATAYEAVAVNQACENKENAYRFIKVLLSHEIQYPEDMKNNNPNIYVPISIVALKKEMHAKMKAEVIDYGFATESYGELTEEFALDYLSILKSVNKMVYPNKGQDILKEEMKPYIENKKSYEECIQSAQSKLEIYISE